MRILFALIALVLLGTFTPYVEPPPIPMPAVTTVSFAPVELDRSYPGRPRLGALRWLEGWSVSSNDPRVGGISAMHVEGGEVLAFSDAGWRFRFPLPRGGGAPVRAEVARLVEGPGDPGLKSYRDAESAAVRGGSVWIGYEGANEIWRYDRRGWQGLSHAQPHDMREWHSNAGAEAMLRLADGRFIVFSEGDGGDSDAALFAGDPAEPGTKSVRMRYRPPHGYRVTDAALLPDGRALLLNRGYGVLTGLTARLVLVSLKGLREGALIRGTPVADFRPPAITDNLEALSVTQEGGRTIVWIASDDNYNPLQRTLLLKFALEE